MSSTQITTTAAKFTGATSKEALRLARNTLGPDAMLLSSRPLSDGFEVVVIAEAEAARACAAAVPVAAAQTPANDPVLSHLLSMRDMLEQRLDTVAWNDGQRRDPVRGRLIRAMLQAGFSAKLSKALLEKLPKGLPVEEGMAFVREQLARALPVVRDESAILQSGGIYALVGPTGAGKTTTTAKLAARFLGALGAENIALVTIDTYRIGASQQLQIYGRMMNIPVFVAQDQRSLAAYLAEMKGKRLVLIDTEGRSQRDTAVADQIAMLSGIGAPVKRLLLLDARSQGDTLNETVYAWQRASAGEQLAGCIFTKLDEATTRGALLDTAIRHRLPVHYLSIGQRVPEDLQIPEAAPLVHDALQPPAAGSLFAFDPDLVTTTPGASADEVAQAKSHAERLRRQCSQLIRAMARDAEELADAARYLEQADVGFADARRLWTFAGDETLSYEVAQRELQRIGKEHVARACEDYALVVCGRAKLDQNQHGDMLDLQSCVLLSDQTGQPLVAPNQWLAAGSDGKSTARQVQWLRQQDFTKPLVHLLPRIPASDDLARWAQQQPVWVARTGGSATVLEHGTRASTPVSSLAFEFGRPTAIQWRGQAARVYEGDALAWLRGDDGPLPVRCVARRVVANRDQVLEQSFLVTNAPSELAAGELAQWQDWGARVESCFRLTSKGVSLLGGVTDLGDPTMMKRLLIAGQVATSAWRVLNAAGERADQTRLLLTELAGRQVRVDRPQAGAGIYEGLTKLFHVLDALTVDCAEGVGSLA